KVRVDFAAVLTSNSDLWQIRIYRGRIHNKVGFNEVLIFVLTQSHCRCRSDLFETLNLFVQIKDRLNIGNFDFTAPLSEKINESKPRLSDTNYQNLFTFIFFHIDLLIFYLIFNVASTRISNIMLTIQKRTITLVSGHPSNSKW